MTDDPRVDQLLEELLDSGATPEEVCRAWPELLPQVRADWQRLRILEAEVSALFPESPPVDGPTPPPPPGTELPVIRGYEVQGVLGRGGMGIVYKAWHLRLNRPVALKMLLAGPYARPLELERFLREAEAVAGLRHPNVVQVYDVGDAGGRPYFTMELVEGGSLARKLAAAPLPAGQAAAQVATLAGAVHCAHQSGVIHRDLKPGNVLLTADGVPKVTDFGLARRLEGGAGLTLSGAPMGTPSYMAPEQARGEKDAIGPATDVYALGAILYECLTGRPPFQGESSSATIHQALHQDPVPPSRLNPSVPRDLETICLKCLHKEPERRYVSAAALADDLRRFGEGRPIHARPVGWAERSWRWGRRNPTGAALLVAALALIALASGGGTWFVNQRAERRSEAARHDAERRNDVGTAVAQAGRLRKGFHFREAQELLEQARQRLEPAGPDDLRRQVEQAQTDLNLAQRLDDARIKAATLAGGVDAPAAIESLYVSVFEETGLGRLGDDIEAVAARVRDAALREDLIAALDDWASIATDPGRRDWLLAVAREADQDPARNHLRRPELWKNPEFWTDSKSIAQLTEDLKAADFSPQLAIALSRVADEFHGDSVALLTAAQARYPQDFWLNAGLGSSLAEARRWREALGYYRAALAIRPDVSAAHGSLGCALYQTGRRDEAIAYFEQALHIDPESVAAHSNLAIALHDKGLTDEAMGHFEQAFRIDPKSAGVHFNLGAALMSAEGRLDEAIDHLRQAVSINPKSARAHYNLGLALYAQRCLDEAIGHFEQALRIDPKHMEAHVNLGAALAATGRLDDAILHWQQALRIDPNSAGAHANLGSVLGAKGRLDEAIDHLRQAVRIDPKSAVVHNNLGIALCEKGRPDEAIDHFQQAVRIDPKSARAHYNLGSALYAAARDAVRASAGKGPEPERADKRRQALAWLRADLELATKLLRDGKLSAQVVATWQMDPALASVRDPAGLAKLPDAEREPWQRYWADVAAVIAADPLEQGRAFAARRDWAKAADCYKRALTRGATGDGHFWFEYAALLLLSGDHLSYAEACAHLVERCGKPGGPRAYHVARACTLSPDAVADVSQLGRLAEKELQSNARQFWSQTEQGALAYRAGQFREAVVLFEKSLQTDAKPRRIVLNWLWLALANHHLGKTEEAHRCLGKAQAWLDQFRDGMPVGADEAFGLHFHNWLEAHALRREAEALVQPTGPRSGP